MHGECALSERLQYVENRVRIAPLAYMLGRYTILPTIESSESVRKLFFGVRNSDDEMDSMKVLLTSRGSPDESKLIAGRCGR